MPGLWYLNRATGLVLLVLMTVTLVLGVLAGARGTQRWWPRFATARLHENLAVLSVSLLSAHIVTAVLDGFVPITPVDAVVPFVSEYRPVWLGLGTLASMTFLVAILSAAARHSTTRRVWRGLHLLVYLAWPTALLHGFGTGTDTRSRAVLVLSFGCVAAVVAAVGARLVSLPAPAALRLAAALLVLVVPVALAGWLRDGPLAPGWSRKAGTPPPSSTAGP
jgi:predicted ferric reductase